MRKNFSKFILSLVATFTLVLTGINVNKTNKIVKAAETLTINYNDTFTPAFTSTASTTDTNHETASGFSFYEKGVYLTNGNTDKGYLMFSKNKGYLYNETDLGTISSIAVTYSSGTSTAAKVGIYFGSSMMSTYTTTSNKTIAGTSKTDTFTNDTTGNGYFQLSTSNKNTQITKIVITYVSASIPSLEVPTATLEGNDVTITAVANATKFAVGLFESDTATSPLTTFDVLDTTLPYTINYAPQGTYIVKVKAVGDSTSYGDSAWSSSIGTYTQDNISEKKVSEIASLTSETDGPYTYYQVTGVVSSIKDEDNGAFYLQDLEDSTTKILVYGLAAKKGENNAFKTLNIKVGDTLTIVGYWGISNNKTQQMMKSYYIKSQTNYGVAFEALSTASQLKLAYSVKQETVASHIEYTKVTSSLDDYSGTYLIVYEDNTKGYVFNGKDAENNYVETVIKSNVIEATDAINSVAVTIESIDGGYAIKTANGYIYGVSGENKLNFDSSTQQLNTISFTDGIISNTSKLVFNDSSNQMRFRYYKSTTASSYKSISLYKAISSTTSTTYDVESTSLRFGTTITKDLYDGLVNMGTKVTFGVISQKTTTLGTDSLTVTNALHNNEITPVRVAEENATTIDETGSYYQFAVLFKNIAASNYDVSITARCYVCIDGTYYYMNESSYSIKSIATNYITNYLDNDAVIKHYGVLDYLANI